MVSCAVCTLPIKRIDPSTVCNICYQIFHNNCINLLTNSKERKCVICLNIMSSPSTSKNTDGAKLDVLIKSVKSLEKKFSIQESNISKKLDETLQSLNNVISENNILKEKVSVLENKLLNYESDLLNEILDRDRRKCNIIIFNAPEPSSGNIADDINLTNSIFSALNLPIKALDTIRLGISHTKPRPLKVNLPDVNCVNQILKAKSKLRNLDKLKHINIDTDKTKLQQHQYKIILNELAEKKNRGETNFRIGYSRGHPKLFPKN